MSGDDLDSATGNDSSARPDFVRDVPVSTVIGLLGVATSKELHLLEKKIDIATQKLAQVSSRLDRMSEQMLELFHDIDRTNVQFGDLKEFLKNILSAVLRNVDEEAREQISGKAAKLTSGK